MEPVCLKKHTGVGRAAQASGEHQGEACGIAKICQRGAQRGRGDRKIEEYVTPGIRDRHADAELLINQFPRRASLARPAEAEATAIDQDVAQAARTAGNTRRLRGKGEQTIRAGTDVAELGVRGIAVDRTEVPMNPLPLPAVPTTEVAKSAAAVAETTSISRPAPSARPCAVPVTRALKIAFIEQIPRGIS